MVFNILQCILHIFHLQLYNALKGSLTQAEAVNYLDFNPEESNENVTLLGLKPEHLLHKDSHKKSLHQVQCTSYAKASNK